MEGTSEVIGSEEQRNRGLKSLQIVGFGGAGTIKCSKVGLEACSTAPRTGTNFNGSHSKEKAEELANCSIIPR